MAGLMIVLIFIATLGLQAFLASRCDWRCDKCSHTLSIAPEGGRPSPPLGWTEVGQVPGVRGSLLGAPSAQGVHHLGLSVT
jgi:hypothetical protein